MSRRADRPGVTRAARSCPAVHRAAPLASPRPLLSALVLSASLFSSASGCKDRPGGSAPAATGMQRASSPGPVDEVAPSAGPLAANQADATNETDAATARTAGTGPTKLLDAGQAPRRRLRYTWRLDQREQLSMDMRTAASTGANGATAAERASDTSAGEVPLPSVHLAIAIDPQSVTDDGDLRYLWRVTSTTVSAEEGTPSQVTEGMRAEVAQIAHLSGSAVVTSRGLAREVVADPGAATGQMVDQVRQTLRDVAAPLPEEEVGVGARWRKMSRLDGQDSRVAQTETFRLVELQDDRGSLDDALAQTAPPQTLHATGQATEAHARMESMLASGQAKMHFDLSRLVPQTAFDGTTTMVLSGRSPDDDSAHSMRMVMHVFIAIAGSRR